MSKGGNAGRSIKQDHTFSVSQTGVNRERSTFNLSSRTITAIDPDILYPVALFETLPGDTFRINSNIKGWLATPLVPFLDNLTITSHWWFCPNRLLYSDWAHFQGEKDNPGDTDTFTIPQIEIAGGTTAGVNKLADFLGIPLNLEVMEVNALPFRMYNRVWNENYRDTNLQDSITLDTMEGNSLESTHILRKRGKRKDYITGALPWPQRGDAVELALGGIQAVVGTSAGIPTFDVDTGPQNAPLLGGSGGDSVEWGSSTTNAAEPAVWNTTGLEVNQSTITVNQLRLSIAIQHVLELDARAGARLPEMLKARWGVTGSDFRLQRPEFLGQGSAPIGVQPVPATSKQGSEQIGRLGGFGSVNGSGGGFTHSFTEHGFIMCLVSIRSDLTYYEGLDRMWSRESRYDYFEPSFANLGEQAVLNKEVFVSNDSNDEDVWGYQERFSEYKYGKSQLSGIMRPNYTSALDHWSLAEAFDTLPSLNDVFIQSSTPIDRVVAVTSEPTVIMDIYHNVQATRVMPVFNTPGLRRL